MTERVTVQVDAIGNFSNVIGEVGKFRSQLQNLKLPDKLTAKLEKGFDNVESKVSHFQSLLNKGITTKGDFSKLISSARAADKALVNLKEDVRAIGDKDLHIAVANSAEIQKAEQALNKLINAGDKLKNFGTSKGTGFINESEVAKIQKLANTSEGLKKKFQDVEKAFQTGNIEQASAAIEKLIAHVQRYQNQMNNSKSTPGKGDTVLKWATDVRQALNGMVSEVERTRASLNQLQVDKFNQMKSSISGISTGLSTATNGVRQFINAETEAASRTNQLNEQVGHLRTQANYFFGLQNMGRLIARGIREAAESVRDLDKAMTETAVVTDFSVSDMWNMLPEYTKLANELGATTQGAYETMTLYFQQGLDKQATFEIGEETMKMARIAGLDYAQTTNMMTAALRGFNMELNQTSAKRVNDVYSELAAITASDTRELGLAMERTASIAHSAGMDFGNTTAFLAQMIETTREAPENLGTAMKTIIARFQELKQNPYEISEVEGEEVDFNRVDKALKTIGVDLMDNKDKFRDLDDVFMDISERWDGLSQTQQRYVATIAAGARQQSRFLAMVQNYDRLKELTTAAANSEGASDVQFNKTLESYEAKVNKLKNAWQAFTMSLANNQAIKFGINALKDIITFGNKIIQTFGKVGSVFGDVGKGLGEMTAAFGLGALGFKGLKGGANLGLKLLGGMTVKDATAGGGMFPGGVRGREATGLAFKITNPIVSAINRLTAVVSGKPTQNTNTNVNDNFRSGLVKERRGNLYNTVRQKTAEERLVNPLENGALAGNKKQKSSFKYFSAADVRREFKDLSALEQQQIYKSVPAIRSALQKGYSKAYEGLNLGDAGKTALQGHFKEIDNAVKAGQISADDALKHLYNPASLANALSESAPEVAKQLNQEINNKFKSMSFEDQKKAFNKARKLADDKQLKGADRKQFIRQQIAGEAFGLDAKNTAQLGKVAGAMTTISSKASMAGQSVMGLGMALDAIGLHGAGGALMTVGNGLIGIGMAAEGAVGGVQALKTALGALTKTNPILLAASGIAAMGAAVVGGVMAYNNKMVKDTREAGDKVVNTYTKTIEKTTEQLDNLKKYKDNWDTWTNGVDDNGYNISLSTEEYQEYLKAVKDITSAHPELIKGYNAIGNAIIDNNTALREATRLTMEDEEKATDAYLKSYDKIVAKQKTYKRWQKAMSSGGENARETSSMGLSKGTSGRTVSPSSTSTMEDEANAVVSSISEIKGGAKILKDFGIELDETGKLTSGGLENLRTHLVDVTNAVKDLDLAPDEEGQKALDDMTEKANAYAKTVQGLEKVSKESYDWGWEYASSKGYDKIEDGLVVPFQTSIERLAEKGLSQSEFELEIDKIGQKYQDLGGHLTDFQEIQKEVAEAQKELGESADFDAYTDTVEVATAEMDSWIAELRSSTDEADHIMAEWLESRKAAMLDYSKNAEADLSEGLNQDQALFKSSADASKRYESIKEQITDYTSGLNSMKAILDDAMTDQNLEGNGSLAFEQASISILGEDFVRNNANDMDKVKAQMKEYQGWLQDSEGNVRSLEDTYTSFWDHITQKAMESPDKTIEGIDGKLSDFFVKTDKGFEMNAEKWSKLTDEQMGLLAEQGFNMSADFMSGMLNIGRQLGYYSSANIDMIKQGLVEQNGEGSAVTKGGETVYKRESDLREESKLAMNSEAETEQIIAEAKKAGIELIGDVSTMSGQSIKTMMNNLEVSGKKSGENFGRNFVETFEGLNYNKDEVFQAIDQAMSSDAFTDEEKASLQETQSNLNQIWDDILEKKELELGEEDKSAEERTASAAEGIESMLGQQLAGEGKLSKEAYTDAEGKGLGYGALKTVLGGKGQDTLAQFFASGKDRAGNALSDEAYQTQLSQLQNLQKHYREQEALLRTNAENTSGEDRKWWTQQADYYQQAAGYLDGYIAKGQEAHQNKMQQNQEETESDNQKTDNKVANDKKEEESEQQKKDKKEEEDIKTDTGGSQYQQYEQLQTKLNELKSQEPINLNNLFGLGSQDMISDSALQFSSLISNLNLSKEQVEALGNSLQTLDPGALENLDNATLSNLLSQLGLTKEQIEILDTLNPNIEITSEADTSEADEAVEEVEQKTAKPKILEVITQAANNAGQVVEGAKQQASKTSQQGTATNSITVQSTVANPNEPKEKIDAAMPKDYKTTVNASITMNASVKTGGLKQQMQTAASKASKGIKVKAGTTSTVTAKAKGSGDVKALNTAIKGLKGKSVSVKASVSGLSQVNSLKNAISNLRNKTVTVTYKQNGHPSPSVGLNNYIPHQAPIHANSLATGTLGNKRKKITDFKGGLTLTGEKGFEIAWLPSENRSMILGAQGPQMVNLPRDAVVWTNEQSKKILKQKAIPASSMRSGTGPSKSSNNSNNSKSSNSSNSKKNNKDTANNNKAAAKNNSDAKKVIKKSGQVYVWWENQARKIEGTQRKVDKLLKKFEKELKEVGKTVSDIKSTTTSYKKQLNESIRLNKQSEAEAKKELKDLANKKSSYSISYQKTTKTKKGKTKKETVNGTVNLADYISYDSAHDTYVINKTTINKAAASNKSRAEAIKKLAEEKINDKLSKRNTAQDNITKAQEALEKLSNDIYENFYRWEKSITQVYILTQKLEVISKKISIAGAQADLQFAKLEAGMGSFSDSLPKIQEALQNERDQLLQQATGKKFVFDASLQEFKDSLKFDTYARNYLNNPNSTEAHDDYRAASKAFALLNELQMDSSNFDYNKAIQGLNEKQYNEETNNRIKAVLDKIFEKQSNFLDAEEDAYKVQAEIYEKMEDYQSFISDFEQDLVSGIDELKEDEINKLEKINSSLSQAYKDLIDEVKNKLDERRKQEDNAKTKTDISQKQQRLAALRADTSGGHQVEIAQLEKEIAEAQQNYQRDLEDQLLDRLQQQGDEAEKQRQRQIDLLEAAKEIAQQTGTNLEEVKKWLENPEANIDKIREAWLAQQGYNEATPHQQKQLEEQFDVEWSKYTTYFAELPEYEKMAVDSLSSLEEKVDEIAKQMPSLNTSQRSAALMRSKDFTAKELKKLGYQAKSLKAGGYKTSSIVNAGYTKANLTDAGITLSDIKTNKKNISASTLKKAGYTAAEAKKAGYTSSELKKAGYTTTTKKTTQKTTKKSTTPTKVSQVTGDLKKGSSNSTGVKLLQKALNALGFKGKNKKKLTVDGKFGDNTLYAVKQFQKKNGLKQDGIVGSNTKKKFKAKGYSTGGIADYTGPAWLHGTPSKPELVLNAADTKNFLALRDVLSNAMKSMDTVGSSYDNTNFEVNINVDHLSSDYDVDKVADRVRKIIVKDAGYRNVTQVRNFR